MKHIILCNELGRLKSILRDVSGPLRYLNLMETMESFRIRAYLQECPDASELPRAQLFREFQKEFRQHYIELMARVNTNNHSLHWWAMPFTNKHPVSTSLGRNAAYFLLIAGLMRSSPDALVVITDNTDLVGQLKTWAKDQGVGVISGVKRRWAWKKAVAEFTPGVIIYVVLLTLWRWFLVRRYKPSKSGEDVYTVVMSLLHVQSFAEAGKYRDVYFGRLVDELGDNGSKAIVFGILCERWRYQLHRLKSLRNGVPVVPVEACLSLWDLFGSALQALGAWFKPVRLNGPVEIDNTDVRYLVSRAVQQTRWSGNVFMNLQLHYCAKSLARTVPVARCIYPYENRALEKMFLMGIRSSSPESRMIGYQHASITLSHTNFILGMQEAKITPLPDVIFTTGRVTRDWLEREGNYPPETFETWCALRLDRSVQTPAKIRGQRITRVLAVLATSLEEYVDTLTFLDQAWPDCAGRELRIRPHPSFSLASALETARVTRPGFYSVSPGTLADDLEWADVVLYASSTVGLEGISLGIPAIHLNLGDFLDTDPMFGWSDFKWSVEEPGGLGETIQGIEAIPDDRFRELQRAGREYVDAYLKPVGATVLEQFLEA